MRWLLAALLCGAAASAAMAETIQTKIHESFVLQINGATAAYTIDESIATAGAHDGVVTIFGKSAGTTRVMVIAFGRTIAYDVVVIAPAPRNAIAQDVDVGLGAHDDRRHQASTDRERTLDRQNRCHRRDVPVERLRRRDPLTLESPGIPVRIGGLIRLAGGETDVEFLLERESGEGHEQQDHAGVHDISTVAAGIARGEVDHRGKQAHAVLARDNAPAAGPRRDAGWPTSPA